MYRLFLLKESSQDNYEKCLKMLQTLPQISSVSIVNYHNFLPTHIFFKSDIFSDKGIYQLLTECTRDKISWKLLKEPVNNRVFV